MSQLAAGINDNPLPAVTIAAAGSPSCVCATAHLAGNFTGGGRGLRRLPARAILSGKPRVSPIAQNKFDKTGDLVAVGAEPSLAAAGDLAGAAFEDAVQRSLERLTFMQPGATA
jgi:hypothetical protein